jgi:hypothetical protein
MCLNETYSRVRIGKNLSEKFTVQNGLKQGNCFSTLFGDMQSGGLILNGTHQLLAYVDDVNIVGENIDTLKRKTKPY